MTGWTVIIPVKPWALSKSRLDIDSVSRERFARAFALDALEAVTASPKVGKVVAVSAEQEFASAAFRRGAVVLSDRPMLGGNALNVAVNTGRWWAAARWPRAPIVVVPADLPSMTTDVFDETVGLLSRYDRAFVPDAQDLGTTVSWARRPDLLRPQYGHQSAAKHSDGGARAVSEVDQRARVDVDNVKDLEEAQRLGVGCHTTEVLAVMASTASRLAVRARECRVRVF